jgi:hypothetical protein
MAHWKKMMDPKETLFAFDLDGRDITLTIAAVAAGEMTGEQGRKSKKPMIAFEGTTKKLAANATNCKAIVALYGSAETNDWIGKRITLFATTCEFGGKTVDCIRIRPSIPKAATKDSAAGLPVPVEAQP